MAVVYMSLVAMVVGLILAGILSNLGGPVNRCGMVMLEKRRYNTCVRTAGHKNEHMCADGKAF